MISRSTQYARCDDEGAQPFKAAGCRHTSNIRATALSLSGMFPIPYRIGDKDGELSHSVLLRSVGRLAG